MSPSVNAYLLEEHSSAKFHPHQIGKDEALGFVEEQCPNNNNNKSEDMGSVPNPRSRFIRTEEEDEEEILFCHNRSTIKHNYRNNIHGRTPEKAHQGWPPMVA